MDCHKCYAFSQQQKVGCLVIANGVLQSIILHKVNIAMEAVK